MNYIILKTETQNSKIYIVGEKLDNKFREINSFEISNLKYKNLDKHILERIVKHFNGCKIIGYDLKKSLQTILTMMYENQIYDLTFNYFDIKNFENKNISSIVDIVNYTKKISNSNLDNIESINKKHVWRIFRGLNYPLYLTEKGYVYNHSVTKDISYLIHKKELENKLLTVNELKELDLKSKMCEYITHFMNISYDTLGLTNHYTIYSDVDFGSKSNIKNKNIYNGILKAIKYLEDNKEVRIYITCIGSIDDLKENYKIFDKNVYDKLLSLIKDEKDLWSRW